MCCRDRHNEIKVTCRDLRNLAFKCGHEQNDRFLRPFYVFSLSFESFKYNFREESRSILIISSCFLLQWKKGLFFQVQVSIWGDRCFCENGWYSFPLLFSLRIGINPEPMEFCLQISLFIFCCLQSQLLANLSKTSSLICNRGMRNFSLRLNARTPKWPL